MILGRDALRAFGIMLDFDTDSITIQGVTRSMRAFPEPVDDLLPVDALLQEHLDTLSFNDEDDSSDEGLCRDESKQVRTEDCSVSSLTLVFI